MQAARYAAGLSILALTVLVACSNGTPRGAGPAPEDGGHIGGSPGGIATASPSPTPVATGSATASPTPTATPTNVPATASPSPTPGPISASPNPLVFAGSGQTLSFTVTDPGYMGQFIVTNPSCGRDASISSTTSTGPSAVFNVTAEVAGTQCSFEVDDSFGGSVIEQIVIAP